MENDKHQEREDHFEYHILAGYLARIEGLLNIWEFLEESQEKKKVTELLRSELGKLKKDITKHYQQNREDNEKKKDCDYVNDGCENNGKKG